MSEQLLSRRETRVWFWMTLSRVFGVGFFLVAVAVTTFPQARIYPKEIRGYKVERAVVEIKTPGAGGKAQKTTGNAGSDQNQATSQNSANDSAQTNNAPTYDSNPDALIKLGKPQLARVTPLGITFEVPIVVAPVKQSGHIDFLLFEEMVVNGRSVEIDEYHHAFDLPNKRPLTLREPLRFYIYLPGALLAALGEWNESKETWPVTGRAYACGRFKKFGFTFKRCIPVELNLTMKNPLRER
jgi:hypothetical protein